MKRRDKQRAKACGVATHRKSRGPVTVVLNTMLRNKSRVLTVFGMLGVFVAVSAHAEKPCAKAAATGPSMPPAQVTVEPRWEI